MSLINISYIIFVRIKTLSKIKSWKFFTLKLVVMIPVCFCEIVCILKQKELNTITQTHTHAHTHTRVGCGRQIHFWTTINPLLQCFPLFSFYVYKIQKPDIGKCIVLLLKMAHLLLHYCYIQDSSTTLYIIYKQNKKRRLGLEALRGRCSSHEVVLTPFK